MKITKTLVGCVVASALLAVSGGAVASGFALIEQSSGLGNSFAGGAAGAEDATTIFFNPAGMSRLSGKQITVAGSLIKPSAKFSGTGGIPGGDNGGDAGSWALVPNAYFAMELNPSLKIGLGVNAPFGLQTEYTPTWKGKAQGIKSKIETINLNPSVSYQVSEAFSIGAGVNYQKIRGELTSFAGALGTGIITGSDAAWGYNLGALYNVSKATRVGVAYRSGITYKLSGSAIFTGFPLANTPATLDIKMPDSFSVSALHQLDDKWEIMGDASWTGWSALKEIRVLRPNGTTISLTPENWKDTWRVAAGASYHYNDQWMARTGIAYDQSPVPEAFRTVRIPDQSRTWLSVGGQYKPSQSSTLDFGYAHLFVSSPTLNQAIPFGLVGSYSTSVDIFSLQYAYNF